MKPKTRQILVPIAVLLISIVLMSALMAMRTPPQRKGEVDTRPTISTMEVENTEIQLTVPVMGKLSAHNKVTLYAEVSGVMLPTEKEFLTGHSYQAGEVMVLVDRRDTELSLKAQRSSLQTAIAGLLPELKFDYPESYNNWERYLREFDINQTTRPLPKPLNDRESLFVANKGIERTYFDIKAQEVRLAKYTIRAPFDGTLTASNITPGNLVRSGMALGVFLDPTHYDLEVTVSLDEVQRIQNGNRVALSSPNQPGSWNGTVTRISAGLDAATQMVKVYISVVGEGLREGMYLEGEILTSGDIRGMVVPRRMLENGNTVLEVRDGIIQRQLVNVLATRGEEAIVLDLPDGMLLVTQIQDLPDGAPVILEGETPTAPPAGQPKPGSGKGASRS